MHHPVDGIFLLGKRFLCTLFMLLILVSCAREMSATVECQRFKNLPIGTRLSLDMFPRMELTKATALGDANTGVFTFRGKLHSIDFLAKGLDSICYNEYWNVRPLNPSKYLNCGVYFTGEYTIYEKGKRLCYTKKPLP